MKTMVVSIAALVVAWVAPAAADEVVDKVSFACDGGKTIAAKFYSDKVDLVLSDGRTLTLPQVMSGSGIRYANPDESFVFWSKGNTAFITEGKDGPSTYAGCIVVASVPNDKAWSVFASSSLGFSIRYPKGYTVDDKYRYEALGPGKEIGGVAFTVPKKMTTGTNLAPDTRLSVETLPDPPACTADAFLPSVTGEVKAVADDGVDYSVASLTDAGAGNLYDETVYVLAGTSPCLAVRYFIHSANIANFDPGTVKEFDRAALVRQFDKIRRTLVIGR